MSAPTTYRFVARCGKCGAEFERDERSPYFADIAYRGDLDGMIRTESGFRKAPVRWISCTCGTLLRKWTKV